MTADQAYLKKLPKKYGIEMVPPDDPVYSTGPSIRLQLPTVPTTPNLDRPNREDLDCSLSESTQELLKQIESQYPHPKTPITEERKPKANSIKTRFLKTDDPVYKRPWTMLIGGLKGMSEPPSTKPSDVTPARDKKEIQAQAEEVANNQPRGWGDLAPRRQP